jgi:transcriptional regulator GlxA family with amidase domain
MKKLALLYHEDVILSSVSGVLDIFMGANLFLEQSGKAPVFDITIVSESVPAGGSFFSGQHRQHSTLSGAVRPDLIMVPAFNGDPGFMLDKHRALVDWIADMSNQGAEVASLCFGSYFLAEAGLLTGRTCTSHWMAIADMTKRYPDIHILPDKVITDQEGIYTSGGAFASLNLVLYLIEKFCGRDAGIWVSKMFSIDMDRVNQAHFAVFQGQRRHEDEEILKAQNYMEENCHLFLSVEQIAGHSNMSKRNFIRRFKKATDNSPIEYLQRIKIEHAKRALEQSGENISTLMYDVGYNDVKTFRSVFKKITGLTPQDYRKKYCRTALLEQ